MKRRWLRVLLCFTMLLLLPSAVNTACAVDNTSIDGAGTIIGDVSGDGKINQKDVARLRQYIADKDAYPLDTPQNADVNGDNKINQKDVARLRQYIADPKTYPLWQPTDPIDPTDPTDPDVSPGYALYYTMMPSTTLHEKATNDVPSVSVPYMTALMLAEEGINVGKWNEVQYQGQTYYLWINEGDTMLTQQKSSFAYAATTQIQRRIIDNAIEYLSKPTGYANGMSTGVADENGVYWFDCSGFAVYILEKSMQLEVPSYDLTSKLSGFYATEDIYNKGFNGEFAATTVIPEGEAIDESKLLPGDILFFKINDGESGKTCNHCGIYMGNGEFIHASKSWDGGVRVMPLRGFYVTSFVAARRYVPGSVVPANQTVYTTSQKTNVYPTEDSNGEPLTSLKAKVPVTLWFTDNGNWAYVEYESGHFGYILMKYLTK